MNAKLILFLGCLIVIPTGCSLIPTVNAPENPVTVSAEVPTTVETEPIPPRPTQDNVMETSPSLPIPSMPGLPALIEKAKADLSQRSSVSAAQINVLDAREVFWPDASLGCPEPGMAYDQIQVPGYLILLQADGNKFEYHANIHNHIFYCENPTPPILESPTSGPPQ